MGSHRVNCRIPGTRSAGVDGVYSYCARSGTALNISTHPDFRGEQLPHKFTPVHPQTGYNTAYSSDSLAPIGGYRGLCPVCAGFHGSEVRTLIPLWARACFQCNACLVTAPLPGLCRDSGGCSLLATSSWQAEG